MESAARWRDAGLLAQIDSVTYSVTKHATVALAEWISIHHGGEGIQVSVLLPAGARTTPIARWPGGGV